MALEALPDECENYVARWLSWWLTKLLVGIWTGMDGMAHFSALHFFGLLDFA